MLLMYANPLKNYLAAIKNEYMKKYCDWWLLPLLACLLAGCGDDDYRYPSVKLEFPNCLFGADGYLRLL